MLAAFISGLGQTASVDQRASIRTEFARLAHYLELDGKVAPNESDRMTELKLKAVSSDATTQQRQAAYKELFALLYRLQGNDPPKGDDEAQLTSYAQAAAGFPPGVTAEATGWATTRTPSGKLGHVEKMGHGPIPLILIPNQEDWSVYKSFMEQHQDRFTMYAVTLPGYGNTPPPPQPELMDFTRLSWLRNAEQSIVNLIVEKKIVKPLIVGVMVGGYLAARLALDHADKVRGAVLVNALVYSGEAMPPAERLRQAKRGIAAFPAAELIPWSRRPSAEKVRQAIEKNPQALAGISNWARDTVVATDLVTGATVNNHPLTARYMNELATTDLTEEIRKLRVPVLVLPAIPDKDSPYQGRLSLTQFEELKAKYPTVPLTIAPFEEVRSYVFFEAGREMGKAIEAFATGKPVEGRR
jgi:pimeloyl-ACP methyl ester carboxylesterase